MWFELCQVLEELYLEIFGHQVKNSSGDWLKRLFYESSLDSNMNGNNVIESGWYLSIFPAKAFLGKKT